jgi:hypothetical protein
VKRFSYVLAALSLLVLAACGGGSGPTPEGVVTVQVENRNASTVDVWASGEGGRLRLGTVLPGGTGLFGVPASLVSAPPYQLQLQVGPSGLGRESYTTPALSLRPGAQVQVTVQRNVRSSGYRVKG